MILSEYPPELRRMALREAHKTLYIGDAPEEPDTSDEILVDVACAIAAAYQDGRSYGFAEGLTYWRAKEST
jgi:hypothetical protein